MKQAIVIVKELKLTKGKMAAQASHASLGAYKLTKAKYPELVEEWESEGEKKVTIYVETEKDLLELYNKIPKEIPKIIIRDAGRTQLEPGTITCLGIGPYKDIELDKYTGKLKLVG